MFKKVFYMSIDSDSFPFYEINVSQDILIAENPLHQINLIALSSNPVVIDLDTLGKIPKIGSIWNGNTFEGIEDFLDLNKNENTKHYSFVVDGKHFQYMIYDTSTDIGKMVTAGLSSNPSITSRLVNR